MKKTVKLGYIPTRRNVFSAEEAREFRKRLKKLFVRGAPSWWILTISPRKAS